MKVAATASFCLKGNLFATPQTRGVTFTARLINKSVYCLKIIIVLPEKKFI